MNNNNIPMANSDTKSDLMDDMKKITILKMDKSSIMKPISILNTNISTFNKLIKNNIIHNASFPLRSACTVIFTHNKINSTTTTYTHIDVNSTT